MASSASSQIGVKEKIEQEFLSCPICYELFEKPKCLPCLHTFCYDCLKSYIVSKGDFGIKRKMGFPCPICKQFLFVKGWIKPLEEWADELKDNFIIQNMIDLITSQPTTASEISGTIQPPTPSAPLPEPEPKVFRHAPRLLPTGPLPYRTIQDSYSIHSRRNTGSQPRLQIHAPRLIPTAPPPSYEAPLPYTTIQDSYGIHNRRNTGSRPRLQIPETLRPSSSSENLSPSAVSPNMFRNRTISSNDLSAGETLQYFAPARTDLVYNHDCNPYDEEVKYSDVCCLRDRKSVVATDYNGCRVIYYRNVFVNCNKSQHVVKVKGRPCSLALLFGEKEEDRVEIVVVNLQNKNVLIFISVHYMKIIRKTRTDRNYRAVAVLAPHTLLAGSPDRPACIDRIQLDKSYNIVSVDTIVLSTNTREIVSPVYICVLSQTKFMVSDADKRSITCYDITGMESATKQFVMAPKRDRKLRSPAGLCRDRNNGYVYVVDYGDSKVLKLVVGDTIRCETLLDETNQLYQPSSLCFGGEDKLCIVDWRGRMAVYTTRHRTDA